MEGEFIRKILAAITGAGLWDEFQTDWVCLDCELMPWSAKAQELLRQQYAAVGAASRASLPDAVAALEQAAVTVSDIGPLLDRYRAREKATEKYTDAYRRYCWPVHSLADLKLARFICWRQKEKCMRTKITYGIWGRSRDSVMWTKGLLLATAHMVVDVTDPASEEAGIRWWEELTSRGGEGMVVKPLEFIARGQRGLVQPAVKCRGP
jgi:protein phosphatase